MLPSPLEIIRDVAGPPDGQRIVDVGCGEGALVEALVAAGYDAEGVEPGALAIAAARQRAPHLRFQQSGAEQLPFDDSAFDVVAMVNALHHVPQPGMQLALGEMRRVLKPTGRLVVIEPSITGSFFEALRLIEDETAVRTAAQAALDQAVASGVWRTDKAFSYDRPESFTTIDQFIARVVAVDPARADIANSNRAAVLEAFARHSVAVEGGLRQLVQPMLVRVLALV